MIMHTGPTSSGFFEFVLWSKDESWVCIILVSILYNDVISDSAKECYFQ